MAGEQVGTINGAGDFERELRALKKGVSRLSKVLWGLFLAVLVITVIVCRWTSLAEVGDLLHEPAAYACQFFGLVLYAIFKIVERKRYDRLQQAVEAHYEALRRAGRDEDALAAERKAIGEVFVAVAAGR